MFTYIPLFGGVSLPFRPPIQWVLIGYLFKHSIDSIYVSPNLPIHPTSPFPLGIHTFVLFVCVSISALQIRLSISFIFWTFRLFPCPDCCK